MLSPLYLKGYKVGYERGLHEGLEGSSAKTVMEHDLVFIYGVMAIILKDEYGWTQDEIELLVNRIQERWQTLDREWSPDGKPETMVEMVERKTGLQLKQVVEDILEAGFD